MSTRQGPRRDLFDEVVRLHQALVWRQSEGWRWLEREAARHPEELYREVFADALYWWRVYRRRHRTLAKRSRAASRRYAREATALLRDRSGALPSRVADLHAAAVRAEEAEEEAGEDFRREEAHFRAALEAQQRAASKGQDPRLAFLLGWIKAGRDLYPHFEARWEPLRFLDAADRRVLLAGLVGVVRGRASVWKNPELRRAMEEAGGSVLPDGAPRQRLLLNLPGAVAGVVLEETGGGFPPDFVRRVVRRLEGLGGESARLALMGRLADLRDPDAGPAGTEDAPPAGLGLELASAIRDELDRLEQRAGLSPQQREVWQRLRLGWGPARIADDLAITEGQVAVQKHRVIRKLRGVVAAEGRKGL